MGVLSSVNKNINELKEYLTYFKRELFNIPKQRETEFKNKYHDYKTKITDYELQAKKLDLIIKGDEVGLLAMERGQDGNQMYVGKGGMYQHSVVKHGFDT